MKILYSALLLFFVVLLPATGRVFYGTPKDQISFTPLPTDRKVIYTLKNNEYCYGFLYSAPKNLATLILVNDDGQFWLVTNAVGSDYDYDEIKQIGIFTTTGSNYLIASRNGQDFLVIDGKEVNAGYDMIGSFISSERDDFWAYQALVDKKVCIIFNNSQGKLYQSVSDPSISISGHLVYKAVDDERNVVLVIDSEEKTAFKNYGFYSYAMKSDDLFYTAQNDEGWALYKNDTLVSDFYDEISFFKATDDGESWSMIALKDNNNYYVLNGQETLEEATLMQTFFNDDGTITGYSVKNHNNKIAFNLNNALSPYYDDAIIPVFYETQYAYWTKQSGSFVLNINGGETIKFATTTPSNLLSFIDKNYLFFNINYQNEVIIAIRNNSNEQVDYFQNILQVALANNCLYGITQNKNEIILEKLHGD